MINLLQLLTFLRIVIVLLSSETAIRYALWWRDTRVNAPDATLVSLMLGIAVLHGFVAVRFGASLLNFHVPSGGTEVFIATDLGIIAGTFYHLIPCWRISCGVSIRGVLWNLVLRLTLSVLVAYGFSVFLRI